MTKKVYDNAVNVLLDAYNNETLQHGNPCGCAIGNLVADANGFKIYKRKEDNRVDWEGKDVEWFDLFGPNRSETPEQIKTGLSIDEIIIIEDRFEKSRETYPTHQEKKQQFNGLCAVLKVMETMVEEEVPHQENMDKLETIKDKFVLCEK